MQAPERPSPSTCVDNMLKAFCKSNIHDPMDITDESIAKVSLSVTPELTVPSRRLATVPFAARIDELAHKESPKGLIDAGGCACADEQQLLSRGHYHGLIAAITEAFANHYPIALRPQHFWLLILQAVAKHVELNSETVRKQWVAHAGKKKLVVRRDGFVLGQANAWASVVSGTPDSFSAQIDANTVAGVAEQLAPPFESTTPIELICQKVTVMDVCKSFFSYKCMTCCGFPQVTLEGSATDWALLRTHAEQLISTRCEPTWAATWLSALRPLLDKLCDEYAKGAVGEAGDAAFWNSMCKRGGTTGSGASTWFNGWINICFPYILDRPNHFTVPYSPDAAYVKEGRDGGMYGMHAPQGVQGPDCADFPTGLADAPVVWDYLGKEINLSFKAGFIGATQDAATGTIRPAVGWFVSHAPAEQSVMQDPLERLLSTSARGRAPPPKAGFARTFLSRQGQK